MLMLSGMQNYVGCWIKGMQIVDYMCRKRSREINGRHAKDMGMGLERLGKIMKEGLMNE